MGWQFLIIKNFIICLENPFIVARQVEISQQCMSKKDFKNLQTVSQMDRGLSYLQKTSAKFLLYEKHIFTQDKKNV